MVRRASGLRCKNITRDSKQVQESARSLTDALCAFSSSANSIEHGFGSGLSVCPREEFDGAIMCPVTFSIRYP